VQVTVNPNPTVSLGNDSVVCDYNFPITIQANGNPNDNYSWNTGGQGQSLVVTAAGTYEITVTDNNGCTSSDDIIIESDPCAGVMEQGISLALYPNPFSDNIQITSTESIDATIEIYSTDGRIVYQTRMIGNQETFNLSEMAKGNYLVKIMYTGTFELFRMIKQ
jgi:hypothetical protein